MAFYFGSQTGTAEKFAKALDEEAYKVGVEDSKVIGFTNFDAETFVKHKLVVIIVATHYEGDPCDDTKAFYKWFKGLLKEKETPFKGMNYTIFGLGDTSYEQYNEMGKVMDEGFEKLGATRIYPLGAANAEFFTTEDDFD